MDTKIRFGLLTLIALLLLTLTIFGPLRASWLSQIASAHSDTQAQMKTGSSSTEGPLILTDGQGEYPLGLHMEILEDPSAKLTIQDVSSPAFDKQFIQSTLQVPIYGYTNSAYWLRLHLLNKTNSINQWFLESYFQNLNYVDLYIPMEAGGFTKKESGALRPFATRDIPYYHVVFKLPLPNQAEKTVYIRVQSGSSMTLDFILWSPVAFAVNKIFDMLGVGLFYGSLLIVLGYHLFLFYSLREAAYFYFILFLACAILFFASYEGIADQFLWPGLSNEKLYTLGLTLSLFFITALKFSDVFLEQKTRSPNLHRLNYLFFGFWALIIVMLPFSSYVTIAQITSIGLLLTPAFAAFCGFSLWRNGYRPARFYLLSWLGFIVGIISVELVRRGTIPSTPISEKSYQIGLIWLVLLWSLALADRINRLKAQTESAYRSVRNSEQRLSQILEGLPLGVVLFGSDQKPRYANQRTRDILSNLAQGIQADLALGWTLAEAIAYFSLHYTGTSEKYPLEKLPVYSALHGVPSSADDIEMDQGDKRISLEIWASPVKDEAGRVESAVAAFTDITQRKEAEVELEEYRKHLESMVEKRTAELHAVNNGLRLHIEWLEAVNSVTQTMARSTEFQQIYGKILAVINQIFAANDSFIAEFEGNGKQFKILAHSSQDISHRDMIGSLTNIPESILFKENFQPGELSAIPLDVITTWDGPFGVHIRASKPAGVLSLPLQAREQIVGFMGLEMSEAGRIITGVEHNLLIILATDIAQIIETDRMFGQAKLLIATEERNRIARDLHDSVAQALYAISLYADAIRMGLQYNRPQAVTGNLEELILSTREAMADMRLLIFQLRPPILEEEGLEGALKRRLDTVESKAGLTASIEMDGKFNLTPDQEGELFSIAQEALNNVLKHAHADEIKVALKVESGAFTMTIQDNGIGFEPEFAKEAGGQGLRNIHERAEKIGAKCLIDSTPGQGTKILLTLKL